MNVLGRGVHATAIAWPSFPQGGWPQELTDFFGGNQNSILGAIVKAQWVGGDDGHYGHVELNTPNGWAPLPDGAYIVKLNQGGALYAYDADTFAKCWKVTA